MSPRHQPLDILTDEDLQYALPCNMTLGELCKQVGEFDHKYARVLKTFKHDWSYTHPHADVATSVEKLRQWFSELEADIKQTVTMMPDERLNTQMVDRADDMHMPCRLCVSILTVAHQ
ncbi:MAG: hypothetical protein AAF846_22725 [Chloroflexota bacterium]